MEESKQGFTNNTNAIANESPKWRANEDDVVMMIDEKTPNANQSATINANQDELLKATIPGSEPQQK